MFGYVWAKAKIEGDKIIVWNDEIQEPKYLRYAWAFFPHFLGMALNSLVTTPYYPAFLIPFRIEILTLWATYYNVFTIVTIIGDNICFNYCTFQIVIPLL